MARSIHSKSAFRPRRARGQSFLRDRGILKRIVEAIDPRGDDLVEIGAGAGELTVPLLEAGAARILAFEPEPYLAQRLGRRLEERSETHVTLFPQDYLKVDLAALLEERAIETVRGVGNLPYSAASAILLKILSERTFFSDLTLMFQLEVAERITARPGTKAYGYLSVVTQQAARPRILFRIPPDAFSPRPKVHSALVRLELRGPAELPVGDAGVFRAVVKALLSHRRKSISNNIRYLRSPSLDAGALRAGLSELDIDPGRRGETLSVKEFAALSRFCASE